MPESNPEAEPKVAIRNVRTREFRYLHSELPIRIQELATKAFRFFVDTPRHPSLRLHRLKDDTAGRHRDGSISVSLSRQYRAIYFTNGDVNVWYWIGTHADYDRFTGAT